MGENGNQSAAGQKSWAQLRQEAGWLGILAVGLWLNAAIALLFYGGVVSAIFSAIAGLMAWTPSFIDLRAQGKRTLSGGGRVAAGVTFAIVGIAMHPASDKEATTAEQANETPAAIASDTPAPKNAGAASVRSCAARDRATGKDIGVNEDGSVLRTGPDDKAKYVMIKVGDEELPHPLEASTLIREECRSGAWSRVRILAPSEFRHVVGWVPSSDLVPIKTGDDGRRVYRASDFLWDAGNAGNRNSVLTALNSVLRQNPTCEAYDPASLLVSDISSNPTVSAVCVGPRGDQMLSFRLKDAQSGASVKAVVEVARSSEVTTTLSKADAFEKCREATLDKISHPSTADFNGWDTTFEQIANESRFSVGLTAKNGFGLELKLLSTCVFDGDSLTLNHIAETR